jgi:two-component system KDP operon response regulator KdpE
MQDQGALVLAIDGDPAARARLRPELSASGFRFVESDTIRGGREMVRRLRPDLVLLDHALPGVDSLVQGIRDWSTLPILVLGNSTDEQEKISLLDAGADDYLTRSVGMGELLARVRSSLRRSARESARPVQKVCCGDLEVDFVDRRVSVLGKPIRLTPREYRLLVALAHNLGRTLYHQELVAQAWGPGFEGHRHHLRVFMSQLRAKIELPEQPRLIVTLPGMGYRLEPPTSAQAAGAIPDSRSAAE